jgi:hypothetical protein
LPFLQIAFCIALFAPVALLALFGLAENSPPSSSFTRSGSDRLEAASLASGEALSFGYDPSNGELTVIGDGGASGFSLSLASDALLHLPVSQTVKDKASGATLLSAAIAYDAGGLRASRMVSAGSEGQGSSTTSYWYGGGLHPLVVTRDGVNYRLIGKGIVEEVGSNPARSYLEADRLGSVRMVTNDQGQVVQSLFPALDHRAPDSSQDSGRILPARSFRSKLPRLRSRREPRQATAGRAPIN